MDVAYGLTPLAAAKLVVYTFGALVHLFLMVLILDNRRLRRMGWLLFALMAGLFMWYSGNLLALNISLYYGEGPAALAGFSRIVTLVGFLAAVPFLVHVHGEYEAGLAPMPIGLRLVVAAFYLPVILLPWFAGRMIRNLGWEPLVALGPEVRWLVLWAVGALFVAAGINLYLSIHPRAAGRALARFHRYLAVLQSALAVGWAVAYLPSARPPVGGLGGYFPTALLLIGVLPSGLLIYAIYRYNFLDLRVQRSVFYTVAAIFGFLIYMNFMRRASVWLAGHNILPEAVTEGVMIFILVVLVEPLRRFSKALHQQFVSEIEKVQRLASEIEDHAKRTGDVKSLQALVEERVPSALELEKVALHQGPEPPARLISGVPSNTLRVPISRGGKEVAFLEVTPAGAMISGEQIAALELLADRLAAALELCRLIADKINLERELAAKERMAFLGEMAARIAHNVKNPLSGMKAIVQLMEEDKALSETARHDCGMLVEEIDRLNRNISQVLRYAKPARDIERPADLWSVVQRVSELARPDAERRHIALRVEEPGPCLIHGGEEAASDIVSNLLVNALEASPEGSEVRISLACPSRLPGVAELSIEDHGPGIPPDKLDKIFQPFFTTRAGGTGLGLAIVKRRVDEIGGTVECQSPAGETKGTSAHPGARFVVRFRVSGK